MDQSAALEAVRFLGERLRRNAVQVSRLVLFGSHATGQASEESDLDVLIVSEDFQDKNIFERSRLVGECERETIRRFQVPLDVIMMTPEEFESEDSLMAQVARSDGIEG